MLMDVRTYTCRPGTIKAHLEIYEKYGLAPQKRHLGEPLAYLITETGPINTYMHIWVYDSAADRSEEHTSELQSLMRISSAVFCLKKNKKIKTKVQVSQYNAK